MKKLLLLIFSLVILTWLPVLRAIIGWVKVCLFYPLVLLLLLAMPTRAQPILHNPFTTNPAQPAVIGQTMIYDGTQWIPGPIISGVAAGTNITTQTNNGVVTINGGAGGGGGVTTLSTANIPALAPRLQGNIVGTLLNLTNFYLPPSLANVDTRQLAVSDFKSQTLTAGVPFVMFTNAGPCSVVAARISINVGFYYPASILSIFCNGVSNGCQLQSFFCANGQPFLDFHGDNIDFTPYNAYDVPGNRLFPAGFNSQSNCSFVLWPSGNGILWSDISYRPGNLVVTNSWHMIEAQQTTAPSGVFTVANGVAGPGQVESIVMFALANSGQGYLESKPALYLDSNPPVVANGTEDFFGGSYYFAEGENTYATSQWGNQSESFLKSLFGFTDGNNSYRFFNGAYFNSSFTFNYTNTTAVSQSNLFLLTYTTTP